MSHDINGLLQMVLATALAEHRQDERYIAGPRIPIPPRSKCRYSPSYRVKRSDKRRKP